MILLLIRDLLHRPITHHHFVEMKMKFLQKQEKYRKRVQFQASFIHKSDFYKQNYEIGMCLIFQNQCYNI